MLRRFLARAAEHFGVPIAWLVAMGPQEDRGAVETEARAAMQRLAAGKGLEINALTLIVGTGDQARLLVLQGRN